VSKQAEGRILSATVSRAPSGKHYVRKNSLLVWLGRKYGKKYVKKYGWAVKVNATLYD
jgi:hypothetical protein